jgi:hypothetical protein
MGGGNIEMLHIEIPIGGGNGKEYTIVNARDLWVTGYTLTIGQGYVRVNISKFLDLPVQEYEYALLSRLILCTPPHLVCHHISGDGLDNTRENLLECTSSEHKRLHKHPWYNM